MSNYSDVNPDQLPRITVLLANYNNQEYVCGAINSVLNQDYPKTTLVIVDDKSTDDSWQLIHDTYFEGKDYVSDKNSKLITINGVNIKAIQLKENVGPSEARNVGIVSSTDHTDMYVVLDADDEMYAKKIQRFVACMIQSPQIGIVYADYDILNVATGNVLREYKEPYSRERLLEECIIHSGAMFSLEALMSVRDEFGFYDRNMRTCEDYDLWIRITEKFTCCHIAESLTLVRVHDQNSTTKVDNRVWQNNWQRIRQKLQIRYANQ